MANVTTEKTNPMKTSIPEAIAANVAWAEPESNVTEEPGV